MIEELQRLGMSGYEAKAYVALVAAGAPLNGYEVAKRSGVPRSTVYETLGKLVGRGAAYEVRLGDAGVGYISLPPRCRCSTGCGASSTSRSARCASRCPRWPRPPRSG
ncbi:TrmB family transcriptional regulator [Nonomuraea ferruginea]